MYKKRRLSKNRKFLDSPNLVFLGYVLSGEKITLEF